MKLKLYVGGVTSPKPSEWSEWSNPSFCLAENEQEAEEMLVSHGIYEVDMEDESVVLCPGHFH